MPPRFKVSPKADRTLDGITFDSKKEMMRYAELKLLQRAGCISDLECQIACPVSISGKKFCTYTMDFRYFDKKAARWILEEVKSSGTAKDEAYKLRRKAAELYWDMKITEVIR